MTKEDLRDLNIVIKAGLTWMERAQKAEQEIPLSLEQSLRPKLELLIAAVNCIPLCAKHNPLRSPLCKICQLHARCEEAQQAIDGGTEKK